MANRDPQRRALDWSEADLEAFTDPATLMAASEEIAQAWRRDADREAAGLIDAEEGEGDDAT